MAVAAVQERPTVEPPKVIPEIRRFELPDLDRHARWFMPRFLEKFSHLTERQAVGFLRGVLYENQFLFLFWDHGVALAQTMNDHALAGQKPIIWERFVFIEDPKNPVHQQAGSYFYEHMARWAKRQGVEVIRLENATDIPHELIKERLGRVLSVEEKFAKV